jgi:hypothetical protein
VVDQPVSQPDKLFIVKDTLKLPAALVTYARSEAEAKIVDAYHLLVEVVHIVHEYHLILFEFLLNFDFLNDVYEGLTLLGLLSQGVIVFGYLA